LVVSWNPTASIANSGGLSPIDAWCYPPSADLGLGLNRIFDMPHIRFTVHADCDSQEPCRIVPALRGEILEFEGESDNEFRIGQIDAYLWAILARNFFVENPTHGKLTKFRAPVLAHRSVLSAHRTSFLLQWVIGASLLAVQPAIARGHTWPYPACLWLPPKLYTPSRTPLRHVPLAITWGAFSS
jgi:hypothetical protein